MRTMLDDGLRKVVAGITTIEEVRRVTQEQVREPEAGGGPTGHAGTEVDQSTDTTHQGSTETGRSRNTESKLDNLINTLTRF